MAKVVVAIGTNVDREANIFKALATLTEQFGRLLVSPVYASESEEGAAYYYNLVVRFDSGLGLKDLKQQLMRIEEAQGRERRGRQVSLDLDILLYDKLVVPGLPHPDILDKSYVLQPLADLLPDDTHPAVGRTYADLLSQAEFRVKIAPVEIKEDL